MNMTWEQKLQACKALKEEISLKMRKPGDWYVSQGIECKDGPFLKSKYGNGTTPQEAVENHWIELTVLQPDQYLVIGGNKPDRRCVRWNGFMWEDIDESFYRDNSK